MLYIASDHAGFVLKQKIFAYCAQQGLPFEDLGPFDATSVDYPDYAQKLCEYIKDSANKGILICGTGIGMSISANRLKGIRAALCTNEFEARLSRQHNDANVLCLGARVVGDGLALSILDVFLNTVFEGGRHQNRIDKIECV
jgi:ribose 5-phosphate isomerase B